MPAVKRIVCLANSRKLSGRCVAGKEWTDGRPGPWVRPVSDRPFEEVSEQERQYENGSDPQVLDVIDIPFIEHRPKTYQTENWLLDPKLYWSRIERAGWGDLTTLRDNPATLWANSSSTYSGLNDRVSQAESGQIRNSLYLLHLDRVIIRVFAPGAPFGNPKRRVQAGFAYNQIHYQMWITDPVTERMYLAGYDGEYGLGECFLTVSLGEPHDGYCYKLVAALITRDRAGI